MKTIDRSNLHLNLTRFECRIETKNLGRIRRWAIQLEEGEIFNFPIIPLRVKIEKKKKN